MPAANFLFRTEKSIPWAGRIQAPKDVLKRTGRQIPRENYLNFVWSYKNQLRLEDLRDT